MAQTSFLPVKITHEEPYDGGTKDLALVGYTADRIRYAIKRESDGRALPLSEWIGHNLCRECQIATPEYAIVELIDGTLAFGSRWEERSEQIGAATGGVRALQLLVEHGPEIFAVHAVDRFMVNPDRHAGNFLFVVRAGVRICLAMDFSMAGPRDKLPFGEHPLLSDCHTYTIINLLKGRVSETECNAAYASTVRKLQSIPGTRFRAILDAAPDNWFSAITRAQLGSWWDNFAMNRLSDIAS